MCLAMTQTPRTAAARPAGQGRILVVEDNHDIALFITHVLGKRGGFDITHTPDPAVALLLVTAQPWDLVVTDLELPVMHGLRLIGELRRLVPALPVMIVTSHEAAAAEAGCPVLVKPLRVEPLLSAVTALISPG